MTKPGNKRAIELAASLAVILHLALFALVRPAPGDRLSGTLVPPNTHYLAKAPGTLPVNETDARLVWSPLLFSIPSKMGFSSDLLQKKPHTPSTYLPPAELGSFLDVHVSAQGTGVQIFPQELMLTTFESPAPQLPASAFLPESKPPAARRVYVAPELKERLVGGIVLPPELNKETDTAWEVHASVSISGQGAVRHIFLDQPLESAELNGRILQLLHGLRFKPGAAPVDGRIEIYSPETTVDKEGQP